MKQLNFNLTLRFAFSSLLLSLLLTGPLSLSAQVYNGSLTLGSQAAVDAFSYTEITENLTISGSDITNLNGLSSLAVVGGGLKISGNDLLTNLDGLSGLTLTGTRAALIPNGAFLLITDNAALTNLDGLSSLDPVVVVEFEISNNDELMNLDGLSGFTRPIGLVTIKNNAKLVGFCGLYSIINSGVNFGLPWHYSVEFNAYNPTIQDILGGGPCNLNPAQLIADLLADGTLNQGQANALNTKLNNCRLNAFNNLTNAWVNAGILTQTQADDLDAAATQHCNPALRIAAQQAFTLGQNYPNPSDTYTVIPFTLTTSGTVSIQLYDASGKMVKNLINQYLTEGTHEVKVSLQSLPAGTYFYKLKAGEQIETQPMIVE